MTLSKFINNTLLWLTLVSFLAQGIIEFSVDNLVADCIVLTSVLITVLYFRWSKALETHPLSSFAIFGFCVTSQFGALFVQTMSWTPIISNLNLPLFTFAMLFLYQVVALLAHSLYRVMTTSASPKSGLVRHTIQKMGIYSQPSAINLWIMGIIGTFFLMLSQVSPVANGFSFLAWSPFLIPVYVLKTGHSYCNVKRHYLALVGYALLIALIAMGFNARRLMLGGVATVLLLYMLIWMRSNQQVTSKMLLKFALFGLLATALYWPVTNMVTAMVMVRNDRLKSSASEMVAKTLDNFQHPEKIELYRIKSLLAPHHGAYNEDYIKNPVLARFVITKFHDNSIYYAGKISERGSDELMKTTVDFFWTALPQPVLDAFKIKVNKYYMEFSIGDMLVHIADGLPLGGLKTGSIFGQGWALFGYAFPFIYFAMCMVLFVALDLFSFQDAIGKTEMAVIGMLNIWQHFLFGITADSFHYLFIGVVRDLPQSVILYAIVFYIARALSDLILIRPNRNQTPNVETL